VSADAGSMDDTAVDRLRDRLELGRVVVPPHVRVKGGKPVRVDGYTYTTSRPSAPKSKKSSPSSRSDADRMKDYAARVKKMGGSSTGGGWTSDGEIRSNLGIPPGDLSQQDRSRMAAARKMLENEGVEVRMPARRRNGPGGPQQGRLDGVRADTNVPNVGPNIAAAQKELTRQIGAMDLDSDESAAEAYQALKDALPSGRPSPEEAGEVLAAFRRAAEASNTTPAKFAASVGLSSLYTYYLGVMQASRKPSALDRLAINLSR